MKASYLMNHQDDQAEEMDKFLSVLHLLWPSFFKNAEESIISKRQSELRAPIKLPDKTSIQKLRNQTTETIESLTKQGPYTILDTKEFCRLRDAFVCRLTLFNARRGR